MHYTNKGAIVSSCRKYRYLLWREWDKHTLLKVGPWRTKAGAPRHPLYVALNTPLEPFP